MAAITIKAMAEAVVVGTLEEQLVEMQMALPQQEGRVYRKERVTIARELHMEIPAQVHPVEAVDCIGIPTEEAGLPVQARQERLHSGQVQPIAPLRQAGLRRQLQAALAGQAIFLAGARRTSSCRHRHCSSMAQSMCRERPAHLVEMVGGE